MDTNDLMLSIAEAFEYCGPIWASDTVNLSHLYGECEPASRQR